MDPAVNALPSNKKRKIVRALITDFPKFVKRYNDKTYPPAVLVKLRERFSQPDAVTTKTIEAALKWKYGRHNRPKVPRTLRPAIENASRSWVDYLAAGAPLDNKGFEWWEAALPKSSFISYSFLVHLRSPAAVPIIDQHNFRAVQHYLALGGASIRSLAKPSGWAHIVLVRDFIALAVSEWPEGNGDAPKPTATEIDRFLMMRGKALKTRKRRGNPRPDRAIERRR